MLCLAASYSSFFYFFARVRVDRAFHARCERKREYSEPKFYKWRCARAGRIGHGMLMSAAIAYLLTLAAAHVGVGGGGRLL